MNTAVLVERKEVEVHAVSPEREQVKSTPLGWFVLLILGTATISHVTIALIIDLVNRVVGH